MKLTDKNKRHIDSLSYMNLLERLRYAPLGYPWFIGETGDYWVKRMAELRAEPNGDALHVAASKAIGRSSR